jgi:hypothetical protein
MIKTSKILLYAVGVVVAYKVYKYYSKPKSVLIKGSDADTPENVQFSTASEDMLGSDGSLDNMINLKKPIYIRPTNSIPDVYDRNIGKYINCNGGYMNATGFQDDLQYNCNPATVKNLQQSSKTDLPKLP